MNKAQLDLVMSAAKGGYQVTIDEEGRIIIGASPLPPTAPTASAAPPPPPTASRNGADVQPLRVRWQKEHYGFALVDATTDKIMWSFVGYETSPSQKNSRGYRAAPSAPAATGPRSGRTELHLFQLNRKKEESAKDTALAFVRAANPGRRVVVVS